tara:strand:+ start:110 stop:1063 length:954 start_codon:yes stop_codon:yes gene_type:complete
MRTNDDIWVREVGLRDGLQSIETIFPTEAKLDWIRLETDAGVPEIELGSFVPPKLLPQLADTKSVISAVGSEPTLHTSALVPNFRGAIDGFASGVQQLNYVLSVSEAHSQANVRKSVADAIADFGRICDYRKEHREHANVRLAAGLATVFGCTISGEIKVHSVIKVLEELLAHEPDEIVIADTVGFANPSQCREVFELVLSTVGDIPVSAHFHDTRGLGLANVGAALDAGVRRFDSSLGGLGGCPYAPGASGNIVTEDLVFMLESMGLKTGISLEGLLAARTCMVSYLTEEPTRGAFVNAGVPRGAVLASSVNRLGA